MPCPDDYMPCPDAFMPCTDAFMPCTDAYMPCSGAFMACSGAFMACPGDFMACPGDFMACPGDFMACPGDFTACPGDFMACLERSLASPGNRPSSLAWLGAECVRFIEKGSDGREVSTIGASHLVDVYGRRPVGELRLRADPSLTAGSAPSGP